MILRSQPGLGSVLAARVLAEFGDDPTRFADGKSRRNYAGTSPITRASGTRRVVLTRVACNKRLRDALYLQAFAALSRSPGARACYDAHAPAATPTTKHYVPWPTASSASCTAAYATDTPTTRQPPGPAPRNPPSPPPLDSYTRGMSRPSGTASPACTPGDCRAVACRVSPAHRPSAAGGVAAEVAPLPG